MLTTRYSKKHKYEVFTKKPKKIGGPQIKLKDLKKIGSSEIKLKNLKKIGTSEIKLKNLKITKKNPRK